MWLLDMQEAKISMRTSWQCVKNNVAFEVFAFFGQEEPTVVGVTNYV